MNKILSYLDLGKVGSLELLLALFPILCGYKYGHLPVGLLTLLIMDFIAVQRKSTIDLSGIYKPLMLCCTYAVVHEIVLYFIIGSSHAHMLNATISLIINVVSIFIIAPKLDFNKLVHSLMWVGIICIIGLIYQYIIMMAGGKITPLKVPLMPNPAKDETRLYELLRRPTSFFWEPAAFVTFMMVPYFYQLVRKKFVLAFIFIIAMLLSGSTTAIFLTFTMLGVYVITQKVSWKYKLLSAIIGCAAFYLLFNTHFFEQGVDKLEGTEFDTNARIMNGIILFKATKWSDMIFGVPYANLYDYCRVHVRILIPQYAESVYCTAFWEILVRYGIFALFFLLRSFWYMIKQCRPTMPYVVCLFIALFTQAIGFSNNMFAFQMIAIFALMTHETILSVKKEDYSYALR